MPLAHCEQHHFHPSVRQYGNTVRSYAAWCSGEECRWKCEEQKKKEKGKKKESRKVSGPFY